MSLVEYTLFGVKDKVHIAIERLKNFEPADGYWLAFSGGKDSVVLYRLAEMAGVKYDAHYSITTVDPPELVQFIKREYPAVERLHPEKSMWELMVDNQFPPMRHMRYCCEELKEAHSKGRVVLTGIRWAESVRRRKRRLTEVCYRNGSTSFVHPIIDWSNAEVWEFIRVYNVPYCSLYDEGFKRLGCVLCPMSGYKNATRDMERWPKIAEQYRRTFAKIIAIREATGKEMSFKTADEMFEWWIRRNVKRRDKAQSVLFE